MSTDILGPDGPRLCSRECDTCIFNPDSPFRKGPGALAKGRFPSFVQEAIQGNTYIICHSTSHGQADAAICRGFYDRFAHQVNILRIYSRLGGYDEVEPPP